MVTQLGQAEAPSASLWGLFAQSFDAFTVVLVLGSLVATGVIVRCVIDVRGSRMLPRDRLERARSLVEQGRFDDLRRACEGDGSFVGRVMGAALAPHHADAAAVRDAAELAASDECARWFRKIEVLNVIGNLAPLVGLAGTVWGMVLAFSSLGAAGGQAGAGDLSLGISKALFHTLLGLCLALPCLFVFGVYRSIVDRECNRALVELGKLVERVPAGGGASER